MQKIQAVILAAGRGTRMKHLTENTPKPMINIGKMNLIEWKIEALPKEIEDVFIVIGYLGEQIKSHFGKKFAGKNINYIEQKELNGTGGALFLLKNKLKDKFLVMMGDDIYQKEDIVEMIKNGWSLLVEKNAEPKKGARVILNKNGTIKKIVENIDLKVGELNNAGMYVLGKEIFEYPLVPKSEGSNEFGLPQTIAIAAKKIPIKIVTAKKIIQVTCPEDIAKVECLLTK